MMIALLIALLSIGDTQSNPANSVTCSCGNSNFQNPYPGTFAADAGACTLLVADAGGVGGPIGSIHVGEIAGSPGPTCGVYQGVQNPLDAGLVTCASGSTDMYGRWVITGTNLFTTAIGVPVLYMIPGTPFSSEAQCQIFPAGSADGGSVDGGGSSIIAGISSASNGTYLYPIMDAGAGALQVSAQHATIFPTNLTYYLDWICVGQ